LGSGARGLDNFFWGAPGRAEGSYRRESYTGRPKRREANGNRPNGLTAGTKEKGGGLGGKKWGIKAIWGGSWANSQKGVEGCWLQGGFEKLQDQAKGQGHYLLQNN